MQVQTRVNVGKEGLYRDEFPPSGGRIDFSIGSKDWRIALGVMLGTSPLLSGLSFHYWHRWT